MTYQTLVLLTIMANISTEVNSSIFDGMSVRPGVTNSFLNISSVNIRNSNRVPIDRPIADMTTKGDGLFVAENTTFSWTFTEYSREHFITVTIILGIFILCGIIGNSLVISAVILKPSLHKASNYLILSLAVTDLMVSVVVMPLAIVDEVSQVWFLPQEVCHIWIFTDVLCCSASILHLVIIAIDRYLAVTKIEYNFRRRSRQIIVMIAVVWVISGFNAIPPLFVFRNPFIARRCTLGQGEIYTPVSTSIAFYLPMIIIIVVHAKIYRVTKLRIWKLSNANRDQPYSISRCPEQMKLNCLRERKATGVIAIVTGTFIVCWLPFFIAALISPYVEEKGVQIPPLVISIISWLGYANSMLNPIIYTVFNAEFRNSFKSIILGKYCR